MRPLHRPRLFFQYLNGTEKFVRRAGPELGRGPFQPHDGDTHQPAVGVAFFFAAGFRSPEGV